MVFTRLRASLQAKKCCNYGKYKNRVKLVLDGGEARRVSLIIYSHKKLRISKQSLAVEVACFTTGMKSEDPHDRFTISVRKGYLNWLKRVCLELDTEVSKYARTAIHDRVRADAKAGKLSAEPLAEYRGLKTAHGSGRFDDLF
jgi:hypothetical protein